MLFDSSSTNEHDSSMWREQRAQPQQTSTEGYQQALTGRRCREDCRERVSVAFSERSKSVQTAQGTW